MNEALTIGNVLQVCQIVAIIAGGLFFLWRMEARLMVMSTVQNNYAERLGDIEKDLKQLAAITIDLARQDERMTAQDKRITMLAQRIDDLLRNSKG